MSGKKEFNDDEFDLGDNPSNDPDLAARQKSNSNTLPVAPANAEVKEHTEWLNKLVKNSVAKQFADTKAQYQKDVEKNKLRKTESDTDDFDLENPEDRPLRKLTPPTSYLTNVVYEDRKYSITIEPKIARGAKPPTAVEMSDDLKRIRTNLEQQIIARSDGKSITITSEALASFFDKHQKQEQKLADAKLVEQKAEQQAALEKKQRLAKEVADKKDEPIRAAVATFNEAPKNPYGPGYHTPPNNMLSPTINPLPDNTLLNTMQKQKKQSMLLKTAKKLGETVLKIFKGNKPPKHKIDNTRGNTIV